MTSRDGIEFLESVTNILKEEGVYGPNVDNVPVVNFVHPLPLQEILQLSLEESDDGVSDDRLKELCKAIVKYSVKTGHRNFYIQMFGRPDYYALAGAWLTDALNSSQYTYEVGPAFALIEQKVLERAGKLFGFKESEGLFAPGGSSSNMYAMVLARYKAFPNVKTEGVGKLPRLVALTSEDSHYSLLKAINWLGLGSDNLIVVKTDSIGRMIPEELRSSILLAKESGAVPFLVNATSGTTVFGAFDPLPAIADICREFGIWMHVDACWGGSLRFSQKYGGVLNGVERADSIAWNPHKLLGVPLQCSMFLVRHKGLLYQANSAGADYLFQKDKFYDVAYDTGDMSVQCGRKVDSFKLWLMWKARGDLGLRALIDNTMENAEYLRQRLSEREGFELVLPTIECTNINFWYIPPSLRNKERNAEWWEKLHLVSPKIKETMHVAGTLLLAYNPHKYKNYKNFFRVLITCHPQVQKSDMDYIIEQIEKVGGKM